VLLDFRFTSPPNLESRRASRYSCAVSPSQISDHCSVIGGEDAVHCFSGKRYAFNDHLLIFMAGAEEDVIDSLVDQLRSRL
jgi:hypothetical protein